jgi:trimeric autotransporter adhesin
MKRILRGDAPTQAQISRLASSATGLITLGINGKTGVAVSSWDAAAIASAWNASKLPEFLEVTAAADGVDVLLTSKTPGQPFEVTGLVNGEATADDEQLVSLSPAGGAIAGTFPLTFAGQTAAGISATALPSAVQAALEALTSIGAGNVQVTGEPGAWRIRFVGDLADVDQPELSTSRTDLTGGNAAVSIETLQDGASGAESPLLVVEEVKGVAGTNAKWRVRFNADPGVALSAITLRWLIAFHVGGSTFYSPSTLFAADASLSEMQAALGATGSGTGTSTYGADNLSLSGTLANSWVNPTDGVLVEWIGDWASSPLRQSGELILQAVAGVSSSLLSAVEVAAGVAGTNEVQSLRLIAPTVGTGYRLKFDGKVTRAILWSEDAFAIKTALNDALPGAIASAFSVGLAAGQVNAETLLTDYTYDGVLFFEFIGNGYQSNDVPLLEVLGVGAEEIQQIGISPDAWKGNVTLTLDDQTAAALDWDATAVEAEAALEALSNVGAGLVTCYGGPWPAAPIVCEFDAALGNLPQLTAVHTLTNAGIAVSTLQQGGAAVVVTEIQRSRGPKHWDDPLNWADADGLPGVPGSGEDVSLELAKAELLYGLRQRCQFTADPTTDRLTLATGRETFWNGQALSVRTSNTLPAGLSAATTYYAVNVNGASLQLALTPDGDAVNLTDAGTGIHQVGVLLANLFVDSRFAGSKLGLPRTNSSGYDEYRPLKLELWATSIEIGAGQGAGSSRVKLATGDQKTSIEVIATGGSTEAGIPAVLWDGDHVDNLLEVVDGEFGIALFPEDAAQFGKLTQRAGQVIVGRDVTVGAIRRTGGELTILGATVNGEAFL